MLVCMLFMNGVEAMPSNLDKEIEEMNKRISSFDFEELADPEKKTIPYCFVTDVGVMPDEFYYCAKLVIEKKFKQAVLNLNKCSKYKNSPLNVDKIQKKFKTLYYRYHNELLKMQNLDLDSFSFKDYEYARFLVYLWWVYIDPLDRGF